MADREYKIQLKIEGDAAGAQPVDAGLKKVEEAAKEAEEALKKVEDQSKRTEDAVSETGPADASPTPGEGDVDVIAPRGGRSWHTPEQQRELDQLSEGMEKVGTSAVRMESSMSTAALGASTLGTASVALGGALTLVGGVLVSGVQPELEELRNALSDAAQRFNRAAAEATGLHRDVSFLTSVIKEYTGAAAEERAEEQKAMNAKLDAALARQKAAKEAEKEAAAIDEVTRAIGRETLAIEGRNRATKQKQLLADENAKTAAAKEEAGFDLEEAELRNQSGLSREERARKEADIQRRRQEAKQRRDQEDLKRALEEENEKERSAFQNVEDARKVQEDIRGRIKSYEPGTADFANLEKQLEEATKFFEKVRAEAGRQAEASAEARIKIRGELERNQAVAGTEVKTREANSRAAIDAAAEADRQERERAEEAERRAALRELRDRVLGGTGELRGRFAEAGKDVPGGEDALKVIASLERATRNLEQGGATGSELEAFNQAMQRLTSILARISPTLSTGLRNLKQEIEGKLQKIESDLAELNGASTK